MKSREKLFASELIRWSAQEKKLRQKLLIEPNYWSSDLTSLAEYHGQIAFQMENYINSWGWPGATTMGQEAAIAASYLVRSCVTQPKFMRFCVPFLEQAFRFGDAWGVFFAELYDTIMYFEGKPQVYGTVLDWDLQKRLLPWRIVDVRKVNLRRSAILLEPMSAYVKRMREQSMHERWPVPSDILSYRSGVIAFSKKYHWNRVNDIAIGV